MTLTENVDYKTIHDIRVEMQILNMRAHEQEAKGDKGLEICN